MTDHAEVYKQQVSNGAAEYESASSTLKSGWQDALSKVQALNSPSTWGTDGPGSSFEGAYLNNGGPEQVLFGEAGGGAIVNQVTELGPNVKKAVGISLAGDEQGAAEILRSQVEDG